MKGSLRLGRIAGIEIGVHYTWLLAFVLITWSLAQGQFPRQYHGWSTSTYWMTGAATAVILFVAVLIHELAHSLVAMAFGMPVVNITLFIFGGVSNIGGEAAKPKTEFAVSIVGPLASLAIYSISWVLWDILGRPGTPAGAVLYYLADINRLLAIFNMLPGFPLDGGRVLRSVVWGITGNFDKATRVALTVGRVIAWGLIGFGIFEGFMGNILDGLWIAFIGWFLYGAGSTGRREVTLQEQFHSVRVGQIMESNPCTIVPQTPVSDVVKDYFLQFGYQAVPVSQDGHLLGIVSLKDIKNVPQEHWAQMPVSVVMTREPLFTVDVNDDLNSSLKLLAEHDLNQVLVLRDGQLAGVLTRAHLINYLRLNQELADHRKMS